MQISTTIAITVMIMFVLRLVACIIIIQILDTTSQYDMTTSLFYVTSSMLISSVCFFCWNCQLPLSERNNNNHISVWLRLLTNLEIRAERKKAREKWKVSKSQPRKRLWDHHTQNNKQKLLLLCSMMVFCTGPMMIITQLLEQ